MRVTAAYQHEVLHSHKQQWKAQRKMRSRGRNIAAAAPVAGAGDGIAGGRDRACPTVSAAARRNTHAKDRHGRMHEMLTKIGESFLIVALRPSSHARFSSEILGLSRVVVGRDR